MSANEVKGADFFTQVFNPRVAVMATPAAEQLANKNKLTIVQMLRPFAQMRTEASLRDPCSNTVHEVRNLRLTFENMSSPLYPEPAFINQLLNKVVSDSLTKMNDATISTKYGTHSLNLHPTAPWFEAFREHFMRTMPLSQHEFTRHFVACLIIVSSGEPSPKAKFEALEKTLTENISELGNQRWFMNKILACRVLIHDVAEGDEKAALELIKEMKNEINRGPHLSYLLSINSRRTSEVQELVKNHKKYGPKMVDPWKRFLYEEMGNKEGYRRANNNYNAPKVYNVTYKLQENESDTVSEISVVSEEHSNSIKHPLLRNVSDADSNGTIEADDDNSTASHGMYLTSADQESICVFVDDFIRRALLPHYETQIRLLYEQLVAKKAIPKSFFAATRKWLGAGRTTAYPLHFGSAEGANFYPEEASEVQLRKLGDLAFIFQMYDIAYTIYYQCKNDFSNDGAHLFHAGSLEMIVLSQFMLGKSIPINYIETAISTYLRLSKYYDFAVRCVLLCCEVLLCRQMYPEATENFLKGLAEESDLKSALLLEQVAFCYINRKGFSKPRKFSFNMILAGYRFNKADQKRHALKAYDLAHQVFRNSYWCYAEDHINLTIGKNSHVVGKLETSAQAYLSLLNMSSRQNPVQQGSFLQDFLSSFKDYVEMKNSECSKNSLSVVALPVINMQAIVVTYGVVSYDNVVGAPNIENKHWVNLEKSATAFHTGKQVPFNWKPSIQMLNQTTVNSVKPRTPRQEPVTVKLQFENPMMVQIHLENLHLLWNLKLSDSQEGEIVENEFDISQGTKYIKTEVIKELHFDNLEIKSLSLSLVPCVEGEIVITGVAYSLCSASADKVTGARKVVRVKQNLVIEGPKLNNTISDRTTGARGVDYRLNFIVVSQQPLLEISFSPLPRELLTGEIQSINVSFCNIGYIPIHKILVSSKDVCHFAFRPASDTDPNSEMQSQVMKTGYSFMPTPVSEVFALDVPGGALEPKQVVTMSFRIRGMNTAGLYPISLLFQYMSADQDPKMPHRTIQKSFEIEVKDSLHLKCIKTRNFDKSFQLLLAMQNTFPSATENAKASLGLTSIVCVSKKWRLNLPSQNPADETDKIDASKSTFYLNYNQQICEQEQFQFSITLDRLKDHPESGDYIISMLPIKSSVSSHKLQPFSDFFVRNSAMFPKNCNTQKESPKYMFPPSLQNEKPATTPEPDLTIAFLWKLSYYTAEKSVLSFGQHHYTVDAIKYEEPGIDSRINTNLPYIVRYQIKFDSEKVYELKKSFLNVDVKAVFHNCCEKPVDVKLFLPESPTSSSAFTLETLGVRESFAFWWVSQSTWVFNLPPLGSQEVSLRACFFKAGTYNLNNFSVLVSSSCDSLKFVEQDCRFASFITIGKGAIN